MITGHFPEGLGCHASARGCLKTIACALPWSQMGGKKHRGVGLADGRGWQGLTYFLSDVRTEVISQQSGQGKMLEVGGKLKCEMVITKCREVRLLRNSVGWDGAERPSEIRNHHPSYMSSSSNTQAANRLSGLIRAGMLSSVCVKGERGPES